MQETQHLRSIVLSPAWVNLDQAELLIQAWNDDPGQFSFAQIAILNNSISATKVSDYGIRVAKIYEDKLWVHGG